MSRLSNLNAGSPRNPRGMRASQCRVVPHEKSRQNRPMPVRHSPNTEGAIAAKAGAHFKNDSLSPSAARRSGETADEAHTRELRRSARLRLWAKLLPTKAELARESSFFACLPSGLVGRPRAHVSCVYRAPRSRGALALRETPANEIGRERLRRREKERGREGPICVGARC